MDIREIKRIVLEQREETDAIFKNEKIVEREGKEVKKYLDYPNILSILGVRRCGKSIFSILLFSDKNFGYINFDDERLLDFKTKDFNSLLQAFYELYGSDLEYIILDEVQNVPAWELFATRLRRTKKIIITGSNSELLSGELATHLTGRYIDFTLFPFSFKEFLRYKGIAFPEDVLTTKEKANLFNELNDYLTFGGFPERFKLGNAIIEKIYSDIITKDVIFRHNIKMRDELRKIAKYLINNFSCEFTYSSLKKISQVKHIYTISNWVSYLEEAFLMFKLERFSFKLKQQVLAPKKIYCVDNGLISMAGFGFSENKGRLMENLVFIELLRRDSYGHVRGISYWKDHQQREVDFVVREGFNIKELIQVCYNIDDFNTRNRELKSLVKASKELKCSNLLVVTWDYEAVEEFKGKEIKFIPLWKWLLNVS